MDMFSVFKIMGTIMYIRRHNTKSYINIIICMEISYNDYNASHKREYIINELLSKKNVGIVSDAGTPLISDPGYKLVQECNFINVKVVSI